ncbi:MAG: hypothetical protein WCF00_00595, partial [Azonexus sp.]
GGGLWRLLGRGEGRDSGEQRGEQQGTGFHRMFLLRKETIMPANSMRRIAYWMPIDRNKFETPLVE